MMCLVNPMDIIAIPSPDSYGKIRCCQYLPVKVIENLNEAFKDEVMEDKYESFFEEDLKAMLESVAPDDSFKFNLEKREIPSSVYKSLDDYLNLLKCQNQKL